MEHLVAEATIENLSDLWAADRGWMPRTQVRQITVADAVVSLSATLLSLPSRVIRQLGREAAGVRQVTTPTGPGEATAYEPVRLTLRGRSCTMDVLEVPDELPVLIGQLPSPIWTSSSISA